MTVVMVMAFPLYAYEVSKCSTLWNASSSLDPSGTSLVRTVPGFIVVGVLFCLATEQLHGTKLDGTFFNQMEQGLRRKINRWKKLKKKKIKRKGEMPNMSEAAAQASKESKRVILIYWLIHYHFCMVVSHIPDHLD